ncbi:MAG: cytochrome c oxidase subunit II [Myxococcaceae bacterium]
MRELLRSILFLPPEASTFAERVDGLHFFVLITTMVVSTAVGLAALLFFVRYRRKSPDQTTEQVKGPMWMEMSFIVIPLIFFVAWFSLGYRDFVWLRSPPADAMDIYVMGKQWMWKFSYPTGPNSVDTLRVPAGRPVRLLITSRDVLHSFFVPEFRVKQDALPGRYTQLWFTATKPGVYQILCTEYCGLDHSMMRGQVVVLPPQEFESWMAAQKSAQPALSERIDEHPTRAETVRPTMSLIDQGRALSISQGCVKCHSVDGTSDLGPSWLDLYGREQVLEGGDKVIADEAYLTRSMMQPLDEVVRNFKPTMPSYQGKLGGPETAALLEYIKSLRTTDPTPLERIEE